MGRRTWVKIFCEKWLRGTIREEKPEIRAVWIDLLVLAGDSAYGDHGIIGLAPNCGLTDDQICNILNISSDLWKEAKQKFIKTKRISTNGANEIAILNWKKYQSEYQRQKIYRKTTTPKVTNKSDKQKLLRDRERDREGDKDKEEDIDTPPSPNLQMDTLIKIYQEKFPLQRKLYGVGGIVKVREYFEGIIESGSTYKDIMKAINKATDPAPWNIIKPKKIESPLKRALKKERSKGND